MSQNQPGEGTMHDATNVVFRRVVLIVALINFSYLFLEFFVARRIGSVSLPADSIDFLEDTALNVVVLIGIPRSSKTRADRNVGTRNYPNAYRGDALGGVAEVLCSGSSRTLACCQLPVSVRWQRISRARCC